MGLRRSITLVAELLGMDGRFVTIDGHRLHYVARGEGPAVVLVHGFAGSTAAWESVVVELARDPRDEAEHNGSRTGLAGPSRRRTFAALREACRRMKDEG